MVPGGQDRLRIQDSHVHTAIFKTDNPQETAVTREVFLTEKTVSIFFYFYIYFYNFMLNYVHNFSTETIFDNQLNQQCSHASAQQSREFSAQPNPVP